MEPTYIAIFIAVSGALVNFGMMRSKVGSLDDDVHYLRTEVDKLHERSNNNKDNLAKVNLNLTEDIHEIKESIVEIKTMMRKNGGH